MHIFRLFCVSFFILVGLAAPQARAEPRTFTDVTGRTFLGVIVRIDGPQISFHLPTGQTVQMDRENLSAADKVYAAQWQANERARKPALVQVDVKRQSSSERKDQSGTSKDTYVTYTIAIRNRSGRPLLDLQVLTTGVIVHTSQGRGSRLVSKGSDRSQKFTIAKLEAGQEHVIQCEPITLTESTSLRQTRYSDGTQAGVLAQKKETKLKSFHVTVTGEGKTLWATP